MTSSTAIAAYARAGMLFQDLADGLRSGAPVPRSQEWREALDALAAAALEHPWDAMRIVAAAQAKAETLSSKGLKRRAGHATNMALIATSIGAVLGLERSALGDLCACAFFADLGYALLPETLLERDVELAEPERVELRAAMVRAFTSVLGKSQLSDAFLLRLLVAVEHSRPSEASHLFSRIAAVASAYDALTRAQAWRPAKSPREALDALYQDARRFDVRIVRALESLLLTLASSVRVG